MFAPVRAGLFAALLAFACVQSGLVVSSPPAFAQAKAEKPFQREDLDEAAVRLEGQIKTDAGQVQKPAVQLRRESDEAFRKNDFKLGLQLLGQIVTVAPEDSASWLRLARSVMQIRPANERERTLLLERVATAGYIAYTRSQNGLEQGEALQIIGRSFAERRVWRPALDSLRLSLDLREAADIRSLYERLRDEHGFRLLDYSVDADAASPRACFQFSETLPGKRTDFTPFVGVPGQDRPAITANEKQLCVEGLKHGERYAITLRAGLPSATEPLSRSAEFTIFVRDRKPTVRFTGKAYVLPRTGQQGIPLVSVNSKAASIDIFRIGDRNLIDTVLGSDFQRSVSRYDVEQLRDEKGQQVWTGELALEYSLNNEVTTAFPIDQALGQLKPGVYVMTASPKDAGPGDSYSSLASQWFIVSDLGLAAVSGNDGIHATVNSLATTAPLKDIEVRLMSRSNEVLAIKRTDQNGYVQFEAGLARGEGGLSPALLVAADTADYAFLNLKSQAFDFSDRGVAGRKAPEGLDAFVYTERGVYRTGETVHITALLRDATAVAATGVPLTLVVERPDGVEYRRALLPDQGIGGRSLSLPIAQTAGSGTWRVKAFADPKRPAIGEVTFMVEDYVPDRLEFELASPTGKIAPGAPAEIALNGRFLYGAPAAGLDLEGEMLLIAAKERPGFPGYSFGLTSEAVNAEQQPLQELPDTDDDGKAKFNVTLDKLPTTERLLDARITVRLAESGGRAVERRITLPVTPAGEMIGVKPLFAGKSLGENDNATFDVVLVDRDGKKIERKGLRYELLKIETRYQWYRQYSYWNYEPIKSTRRIADGRLDVTAGDPARLSLPVNWGRYRLEISTGDPAGPLTAVSFDAGFYAEAGTDTPDTLEIALDKPEYKAGDTMNVAVTARSDGRVTLNVVGDRLLSTVNADVKTGLNQIRVPVGDKWGNGAYVVATLRRPLDAAARRMPGRAIGVQWFTIDKAARTLSMELTLPQVIRPNSTLRVPVKLTGLNAGEEARITLAAVDVGILNLTNYKPPAPDDYYLGQRRLSAELRDLYGQLIDGMQGTRGAIRTGGDDGRALEGSPPTQKPLALYSGIVEVKPDGSAEVVFEIPAFAGTARVMGVAWTKDRVGKAVGDVIIRDPVVVTATLPRFLNTGDKSTLHLDLDNVEGQAGDYVVTLQAQSASGTPAKVSDKLALRAKQRQFMSFPLEVSNAGPVTLTVNVAGPGGFSLDRAYALNVRPATQQITRRTVRQIAKGESITLSGDLFADLVPGTGSLALSVSASTALDAATILKALDRYPFGCSEQITSRALPLLYVNDLAAKAQVALDTEVDQRIRDAIERLLARQGGNGGFGLWSVGGDDPWLDAYVTDFLTRARERGFAVPDVAFRIALDRLRNNVAAAPEPSKDGARELAYALYVLARNGVAPLGDLRYIADTKLNEVATPIAKAQIAAALGLLGDRTRADRVYQAALDSIPAAPRLEYGRSDYGSALRDAAALVTLASEGNAPRQTISGGVSRIEAARQLSAYTSTQENAWLVLAARAIAKDAAGVQVTVNGDAHKGALYRTLDAKTVQSGPLRIGNAGEETLQAVVSVNGAPLVPEPAAERGFKIERNYFTLDGQPADITKAKQNDRFAVVLRISEQKPQFGRIIVADYLPAGLEIDNPRLVSSGETGTLGWIELAQAPVNAEFRDDRFTAAFERKAEDAAIFTVAYVVRAVSPGTYVHPQAFVEDMYNPDRFGRTGSGSITVSSAK